MHIDIGIVTLIWVFYAKSYFILQISHSKTKWGIRGDFTIIIFKVIHENARKYGNLFYESDAKSAKQQPSRKYK